MLTIVMVFEDLLRMRDGDGHYETGWSLYQALAKNSRLYLLSHCWTEEETATWLRRRNLTGHLGFLHAPADGPAGRLDALERIRSWRVSLVLEPDPACAAAEITAGWNVAFLAHALYTRPEWRPDYAGTPRPWDDLTRALQQQQALHDADDRLNDLQEQ